MDRVLQPTRHRGLIHLITPDYEMKSVFAGIESGAIFRGYAGFPFEYFKALDDAYEQCENLLRKTSSTLVRRS